jgi:two-component system, LytTR family, response regulator
MSTRIPNLLIVDDEEKAREAIRAVIRLTGLNVSHIREASGVEEAMDKISQYHPEIILLDVQLNDGTGFDILQRLQSPLPQVIFITAYEQHALSAFRFSAIDYLLKPVDPGLLKEAIEKAARNIATHDMESQLQQLRHVLSNPSKEHKKIVLKTTEQIHVVNVREIIRLEADKNYTTFFMNNDSRILVSKTLKEYDELLSGFGFLRVHQSHLVNMDYIDRFDKRDGGFLILKNRSNVPVSSRKREELIRTLENF